MQRDPKAYLWDARQALDAISAFLATIGYKQAREWHRRLAPGPTGQEDEEEIVTRPLVADRRKEG